MASRSGQRIEYVILLHIKRLINWYHNIFIQAKNRMRTEINAGFILQ